MSLVIRPATQEDAPTLAPLAARVFSDAYGHAIPAATLALHLHQHYSAAAVRGWLASPRMRVWLAVRHGRLLGFARVDLDAEAPPGAGLGGVPELAKLYLEGEARGDGVGRALLRQAVEFARAQGHNRLWLAVWQGNPRAIRFYAQHGFVRAGSMHIFVEDVAFDDDVMVCSLNPPEPLAARPAPGEVDAD